MKVLRYPRGLRLHRAFFLTYAERDGGCVLKGDRAWTKVNGFCFNPSGRGAVMVLFRRYR